MPEVSYIESTRSDSFDSANDAYQELARMVEDSTGAFVPEASRRAALERLRDWLDANLVENERAGEADAKGKTAKRLRLREPRSVTWAFISWNK